jgi:hypothetical protein
MNESERRSSKYSSLSILYALMVLLLISSNRGLISSDRGAGGYFLSKSSSKRISACLSGIFCLKAFPFSLSVAVFVLVRMLQYRDADYFTTIIVSCGHFLLCQVIVPAQGKKNAFPDPPVLPENRNMGGHGASLWEALLTPGKKSSPDTPPVVPCTICVHQKSSLKIFGKI